MKETDHFKPFTRIFLFSDGSARHFKQVYTLHCFSTFPTTYHTSSDYNFFASYHGHGLWDAHFGHNNTIIQYYLLAQQGKRLRTYDASSLLPTHTEVLSPLKTAAGLQQLLSHTYHS